MTRVLIVAPSAVVRAGLETILAGHPTIEVAAGMASIGELAHFVETHAPDVVLVDFEGSPGSEDLVLPVGESTPDSPAFVVLTGDTSGPGIAGTLRQGARAVLPRGAEPAEIAAAVEAAAAGLIAVPAETDSLLPLLAPTPRPTPAPGAETLTPREIEVLGLLAEGAGNKQIARRLGISEHTVKFHVGSILGKLGAASRTEAVTIGLRLGLIMV